MEDLDGHHLNKTDNLREWQKGQIKDRRERRTAVGDEAHGWLRNWVRMAVS